MDAVEIAFEALKLSRDWATWLAGIAVASIGGLFALLTAKEKVMAQVDVTVAGKGRSRVFDGRFLLLGGLLCLSLSVAWASIGLAGMPDVAMQIGDNPQSSIFSKVVAFPFPIPIALHIPLWVPLYMQNVTFALGMFLIVLYLWFAYVGTMRNGKNG